VQSTHWPLEPQAMGAVPAAQVPPLQQPPLQGRATEQLVVQRCVLVSQAVPPGQSPVEPQPQAPLTQAWPEGLPLQSMHACPSNPHAVGPVPAAQLPPLQQPPPQGCVAEQAVPQRCVVVLQAKPAWQSAAVLHPQAPFTQARLFTPSVQSVQAPPLPPQAVGLAPAWQEPPEQQPPLQSWEAEQANVHW
jgi:hypothetical protein